jgi:hypothetical protein
MLEANFNKDYSDEKFKVFFELIREDGWSEERFRRTFKWFLLHKKFPEWTIADWFQYGVKLYPYSWYVKQCTEGTNVLKQMDRYRVDGVVLYKFKDGEDLPFERL